MRKVLLIILLLSALGVNAQDSLSVETPKKGWLARLLDSFSEIDTNYVEPQHYNWALMLQSINTYDYYRISTPGDEGQSISFAPTIGVRMGPYFGWRWIFLGYTIDLRNIHFFSGPRKLEIDGSIYSSRFGADIFYRRSVDDYKIRRVYLGKNIDTEALEGQEFNGLNVSITGVNFYYIFNHKRFSYPAAFAQSTCQKISCGSWMVGLGYLKNDIESDHKRLEALAQEKLGHEVKLDSGLMFNRIKYTDINASVGYAYNWVFARNWLFCSSLSLALGYKKSYSEEEKSKTSGFDFSNFNVDGIGRFGIVWNNTKWYAGASAIVRAYNYHKSRFAANNIFGDLNIYVGLNFGPRGPYKKKRTL
jgi:hypothetical protein